jgi:hypothetical protein
MQQPGMHASMHTIYLCTLQSTVSNNNQHSYSFDTQTPANRCTLALTPPGAVLQPGILPPTAKLLLFLQAELQPLPLEVRWPSCAMIQH